MTPRARVVAGSWNGTRPPVAGDSSLVRFEFGGDRRGTIERERGERWIRVFFAMNVSA
jgi:hypothetical protein